MTSVIISEVCPYCRKPRSPRDLIHVLTWTICVDCQERHLAALEGLATGKYTGECSECARPVEEIRLMQGDGDTGVRMAIHFENGIYRPMCLQCDSAYVPKRSDLYGGTEYWKQKGL